VSTTLGELHKLVTSVDRFTPPIHIDKLQNRENLQALSQQRVGLK